MRVWPWLATLAVGLSLPIIATAQHFRGGSGYFIFVLALPLVAESITNLESRMGIAAHSDRFLPRAAVALMILSTACVTVVAALIRGNLWLHLTFAVLVSALITLAYRQDLKAITEEQTARL